MKIGVMGAGAVALAIAREALAKGHEVTLSGNGPEALNLAGKVAGLGPGASVATVQEAAALDHVLLAMSWAEVEATLSGLPAWNGRVLIDATNHFIETGHELVLADLGGVGASEIVARLAPGARVVKAFSSVTMTHFNEGPIKGNGRRVIFVSGDDAGAKATIKALIESFGFAAIDLGGLVPGGRMQQAGGPLAGLDLLVPCEGANSTIEHADSLLDRVRRLPLVPKAAKGSTDELCRPGPLL